MSKEQVELRQVVDLLFSYEDLEKDIYDLEGRLQKQKQKLEELKKQILSNDRVSEKHKIKLSK